MLYIVLRFTVEKYNIYNNYSKELDLTFGSDFTRSRALMKRKKLGYKLRYFQKRYNYF